MANEPKKRSITGKLVANVLTERETTSRAM